MKIAVNTRFLLKDKLEGIGWFTFEVVKRLAAKHPEHEFVFFFDRKFDPSFITSSNIKPVVIQPPARHPFLWYLWFEWSLPFFLKKEKIDLFLSTDGYLSLSTNTPSVVVMHDLAFEHHPEDVSGWVSKYYRFFTPRFAKAATRIFTVSEFTKTDIHTFYGIDRSRIDVVYNGVNELFKPISGDKKQLIQRNYAYGKGYFVYVGALHPRKNITRLLLAFDRFKRDTASDTKLVIVGRKAWGLAEMEATFNSMTHSGDVVFTGRLDSIELSKVIASSKALVYVPYFEGFGIPIIEAQACETAVITSNRTSMPEVAGEGALLVDPFNTEDIASAMKKIDLDDNFRTALVEKGRLNVQRFSWEKTADKVWQGMMNALDSGNNKL